MARFPLEPQLSKVLIRSAELGCSDEVVSIVALLSVSTCNFFCRPKKFKLAADRKKAEFFHPEGDHLMLLNVYKQWVSNNMSKKWAQTNFLKQRNLEEAHEIRKQLIDVMQS